MFIIMFAAKCRCIIAGGLGILANDGSPCTVCHSAISNSNSIIF